LLDHCYAPTPVTEELGERVKAHGKCIVVTEEPVDNTFAQGVAGKISKNCFESLDAPVEVIGSENMPAIPLNSILEATMIPNANKVSEAIKSMLSY
jgi:2-oxoisovalerate dehydrogenase E1 component